MDELEASIATYEAQLSVVDTALTDAAANADLLTLKENLGQLITLTKQNLLEEKKKALLKELEESHPDEDLSHLEGSKVKAPFRSKASGATSLCNALITNVECAQSASGDVTVRVIFTQPTSNDMLPCAFFMDGKCRFEDDRCRYSHGAVVNVSQLGQYEEPDFSLVKADARVMMKSDGDTVWKLVTVITVEDGVVHAKRGKELVKAPLENTCPLSGGADDNETITLMTDDDDNFIPVDLNSITSSSQLGAWEEHTRGIGSRLMAKMGYVTGSGLGVRGSGRVEPVDAMVYPQGKSLDWCMELRERAGGGDVLSVEKTLLREKKKEAKAAERRDEEQKKRENSNVFDFINNRLSKGSSSPKKKGETASTSKDKASFNVESFKVSEDIRRVEKELERYRGSYSRLQGKDPKTAAGVKAKMGEKEAMLAGLRRKEASLGKEKRRSDGKKNMGVF